MTLSIRYRLIAVALLGALACAGALFAIRHLVRSTQEQRLERAHEHVLRELEHLRNDLAHPAHERLPPPVGVQAGYLDPTLAPVEHSRMPWNVARPMVFDIARSLDAHTETALREMDTYDATLVVGVGRLPTGGFVWAVARISSPAGQERWRVGLWVLALASVLLVLASIHTLTVLRAGARRLTSSLGALEQNLDAPVDRTNVEELRVVADGIAHLATQLSGAQREKERLVVELAQRERLASLGRVAAGIAHEVRNPLASIKLRIDLSRRNAAASPELVRDLSDASDEVARLDRLVADLLTVAGRRVGTRTPADVGALARRRRDLLVPWSTEQRVTVQVDGDGTAPIDADAIARVIDNLLRNAVQASPPSGTVRVRVRSNAGYVILSVEDEGTGVPEDRREELFEPFFTTRPEGTGLGLALCRALVESHGGSIRYDRDGGITRFTITLPATVTEPPNA